MQNHPGHRSEEWANRRAKQLLTPSLVQTQVTQGEMLTVFPLSTSFLLIIHLDPRSLQWFRSIEGKLSQGTRGFLLAKRKTKTQLAIQIEITMEGSLFNLKIIKTRMSIKG